MSNDVLIISSVVKNVVPSIFYLKFSVIEKIFIREKIVLYKIALEDNNNNGGSGIFREFCLYEIVNDNFLCEKCFKYDNYQTGKVVFKVSANCYRYYCKKCVDKI